MSLCRSDISDYVVMTLCCYVPNVNYGPYRMGTDLLRNHYWVTGFLAPKSIGLSII